MLVLVFDVALFIFFAGGGGVGYRSVLSQWYVWAIQSLSLELAPCGRQPNPKQFGFRKAFRSELGFPGSLYCFYFLREAWGNGGGPREYQET